MTELEKSGENKIKQCPYCAEEIKDAAIICKHCKTNLLEEEAKRAEEQAFITEELAEKEFVESYVKGNARGGYIFIMLGLILGFLVGISNVYEIINSQGQYTISDFAMNTTKFASLNTYIVGLVGSYLLWSLYWGVQIVSNPIKRVYSGLIIFSSEGVLDWLLRASNKMNLTVSNI